MIGKDVDINSSPPPVHSHVHGGKRQKRSGVNEHDVRRKKVRMVRRHVVKVSFRFRYCQASGWGIPKHSRRSANQGTNPRGISATLDDTRNALTAKVCDESCILPLYQCRSG